jgi:hypothetical protein
MASQALLANQPPTDGASAEDALPLSKRLMIIGSHAHLIKYADKQGVVQSDASLNVYCHLGKRKVLVSAAKKEFKGLCIGVLMSSFTGDRRFSVCDGSGPDHASFSSPAHKLPKDYRSRMQKLFR